jgi:DNA-directed RNA polymerase subunit RPC12/RpoP
VSAEVIRLGEVSFRCLACGDDLPESYQRAASLRCDGCRHARAPLNAAYVENARHPSGLPLADDGSAERLAA